MTEDTKKPQNGRRSKADSINKRQVWCKGRGKAGLVPWASECTKAGNGTLKGPTCDEKRRDHEAREGRDQRRVREGKRKTDKMGEKQGYMRGE